MTSTKNPEHEAENPAPMPQGQQGQKDEITGGSPQDRDPAGQQGGTHTPHMAPQKDAPPGLEQDGRGNVIPLAQRTPEGQEKALSGKK
jgi:hypothetical protein